MEHSHIRQPQQERTLVTEQRGSVRSISRGLTVNPRVHVAFLPPQVLADPVGGQSPVTPFLANGALRNGQNGGYIACRKHTVGTAQCAAARLCVPSPMGTHLFRLRVLILQSLFFAP